MPLVDHTALTKHRERAARTGAALFLHERAADDVHERLSAINRTFPTTTIVTPFPEIWSGFDANCVAPADILDIPEASCDLIVHAMCLHWDNDPVGQLIQCRRALRPDGLLIATLLGGDTLMELREALTRAEADVTGGLSPRVLPMGDIRDLGALLFRAGLALPVADSDRVTVRYSSALSLMQDLRAMGETNALNDRPRTFTRREVLMQAAALYPTDDEGRAPASFELITLTGWAPDASQPQPLKPGSATTRLEDALTRLTTDKTP